MQKRKLIRLAIPALVLALVVWAGTTDKLWPFTSTSESWSGTNGSYALMSYASGIGNSAGSLQGSNTSKGKSDANGYWEWSGTWMDLGVGSDQSVTQISLQNMDTRLSTCTNCNSCTMGPLTLRDSGGTLQATLWSGRSASTQESSWSSTGAQSAQGVPSGLQPASTSIKLRIGMTLANKSVSGATSTAHFDNVAIQMTTEVVSKKINRLLITKTLSRDDFRRVRAHYPNN